MTEELLSAAPPSKRKLFIITAYVDADHVGDSVTRRPRTGYTIYLNNAPVYWIDKETE